MSFRANLQCLRARHNMTQEQLAMLLGVSRQSVTKWESGRAYPEMDKLIKMCAIFGCTLDGLVQGDLAGATRTSTAGRGEAGTVTGGTRADGGREERPGDAEAGAPGAGKLLGRGLGSIAGEGSSAKPLHVSDGPVQDVCGYDEQMRRFAFQIPNNNEDAVDNFELHELESLDIPERERERLIAAKRVNNRAESVCGIVMLVATIVALSWLFGFVWLEGGIDAEGAWERAAHQPFWLPWIIGGLTCAIASIIIQERDDRGR